MTRSAKAILRLIVGSLLALQLDADTLRRLFAAFLVIVAARMIRQLVR